MPCRTGTFAYLHTQKPAFHAKSRLERMPHVMNRYRTTYVNILQRDETYPYQPVDKDVDKEEVPIMSTGSKQKTEADAIRVREFLAAARNSSRAEEVSGPSLGRQLPGGTRLRDLVADRLARIGL